MEKTKQLIDRMPALAGLSIFIDLIQQSHVSNPNVALDAAKSLLESLAKTILSDRGIVYKHDSEIKYLVKEAVRTSAVMNQISDPDSLQRIVQGFDSITNAIGTLRNRYGLISHGQDMGTPQIDSISVDFVIESAFAIVHFLLALHSHEGAIKKRISYDENQDFNTYIDTLDEDNKISIVGVTITPSKALFAEDPEAYREELITYKDIKAKAISSVLENCNDATIEELYPYRNCFLKDELEKLIDFFNDQTIDHSTLGDVAKEYLSEMFTVCININHSCSPEPEEDAQVSSPTQKPGS